jgi:radical SAM superfamily enzyme YgiQ (UPF0313 family)
MYKGVRYRRRPLDEALALVAHVARQTPHARVFLADGDVMARPYDELVAILEQLHSVAPGVRRVNTYANASSILQKDAAQLGALRALRLHTLYMGLESGDETLLQACRKGETAASMAQAGILAQEAGLRMSVMVLLGLGGCSGSAAHVRETALILNRMQRRLLSALRVVPVTGTQLHKQYKAGAFALLSERAIVKELRDLVAALELDSCVFRANHSSNVIPIEARFPRDKQRLLAQLQQLIDSRALSADSPGPLPMWL